MERVYICTEGCQMIIELKFEVVQALRGEREDVELRSGYPYLACRLIKKDIILEKMEIATTMAYSAPFSYRKMWDSLTNAEQGYVISMFNSVRQRYKQEDYEESRELEFPKESNESRANDEIMLSWDTWYQLPHKLRFPLPLRELTEFFERHDGSAKASDHLHNLPRTLVPIYEEYNKYIKRHVWRGQIQSVLVFYFCAVLFDMHIVKVVQINEEKLRQWLTILNVCHHVRFHDWDIANKLSLPIARANFVIKVKESMDEAFMNLREEVEELEEQLQAIKKKKEVVAKRQKEHDAKSAAAMREFTKHYKEALRIKYKPTNVVTE